MSPADELPIDAVHRLRGPIEPSLVTVVQVKAAWMIAFVCVAVIALLP